MQLVERHVITKNDPRWPEIDAACFLSKNLYNAANYVLRQEYINNHHYVPYAELARLMKNNPDYCALPRKVSQWVLKQVDHDWQAFFTAHAEWHVHPEKFNGRPRLPGYKHKTRGRNLLVYTGQAISQPALRQGFIRPSQLGIEVKTQQQRVAQVRIVPRRCHYVVEVVYTVTPQGEQLNPDHVLAIDTGIDNLAALASNQPGFVPLLVNGKPLKSINHHYNRELARLKSALSEGQRTSNRIQHLTFKRNQRVDAYLHLASRRIIDLMQIRSMGTLVIGKNEGWKQGIHLGKRTNQNFVQIPHARFIQMLTYKAELAGIKVLLVEESYTSKCSFLDAEPIGKHEQYVGKRVHRGLFRASDGRTLHADVNGSLNIVRKVVPDAFTGRGIGDVVVHPVRISVQS